MTRCVKRCGVRRDERLRIAIFMRDGHDLRVRPEDLAPVERERETKPRRVDLHHRCGEVTATSGDK
jgi:hypothetical protein